MSAETGTPSTGAPRRPSRRKRWIKRLVPLTLLLLALWFAPAVVAKTELRNRLARIALSDVRGSVDVGGASLGWLAPVELRDVTIRDEEGRPVASAAKISSHKSLAALARDRTDPGTFTVAGPVLTVVCDRNTTNVEGAFAEYLKGDPSPAATRTPVSVAVTGGTLVITDAATGTSASIEGIDATVAVPAGRSEPVAVRVTAATGALNLEASVGATGTAKLVSADLVLDAFAPLLARADPGLSVTGALSTDLRLSWGADAQGRATLALAGTASGKRLALGAAWLKGDRLRFDFVKLPLDVELAGRDLRVRAFDLTCDAGTVSVRGAFNPEAAAESVLTQAGVSVSARVEVARLAAQLPQLLRLREGTELSEGRIEVKLVSATDPADGGAVWEGSVNASALKGARGGKPIAWEQPLHAEFVGRYVPGRFPTFKKLVCTSDVISVNAASGPDTLQVSTGVFLDRLGAKLRDFVDLDGFTLGGQAFASFAGGRDRAGRFDAEVIVRLTDFVLVDRANKGLREPALELRLGASGTFPADGPVRLAAATAKLTAGGDELDLTLFEPVPNVRELSGGSADVRLTGQIASWKARAGALVGLPEFTFTGAVDARGRAKFVSDRVTVERLAVTLTKPKLERWVALDESVVTAVGDLEVARATRTATVTKLAITSDVLKVAGGTLAFEFPANGPSVVSGNGQCTADLNRLGRLVKLYADPAGPDALHGTGAGPVRFRTAGDVTTFGGTLAATDFGYGPKAQLVWFEPALQLELEGRHDDTADAVTIANARAERPGLVLDAKGELSRIAATRDVNFSGTLRYDWERLTPLVRKFAGNTFTATGTGTRGFVLSGQLEPGGPAPAAAAAPRPAPKGGGIVLKAPAGAPVPRAPVAPSGPGAFEALSGEAGLGWHSLAAYGFDVGTGELKLNMTRGVGTVAPLSATFGGGKVTVAPTLHLAAAPYAMTLAKGTVVERAKLTPAATAGALGYALPAIANAAQAEGEISATVDDNRIALGDANQTVVKGTLLIHKATVGLGPVAAQIATLLGAKATTMTLVNESAVPVQVANGRVHHQNFAVRIAGTTFHTSGSVGFDDTLDLVVDVPLPKDLPALKNNPVLTKAVAGKVVKVPLKGTLTKPELDPKAFNEAVIALARQGAKDAGKDLIESELKKLLPGAGSTGGGLPFQLPFGRKP